MRWLLSSVSASNEPKQTSGSFSPAEIRWWQQRKVTKGHLKGQARGRKLAFNPCCHRNNRLFWRSGDRDQRWQSLRHVRSWSTGIFNAYTWVFGPYIYFLLTSNKGHHNATVSTNSKIYQTNNFPPRSDALKLCKEIAPLYLHLHVSISFPLLNPHIDANTSNSSFSFLYVPPFEQ